MRISARCDYACKALLELSAHWPDKEPLHIQDISKKQDIPIRYLVNILIQLKRLGYVKSLRGKEGGYNLAVAPGKITLGRVIRQITGPLLQLADSAANEELAFKAIWKEVDGAMSDVLDRITFEDILSKVKGLESLVNYQI